MNPRTTWKESAPMQPEPWEAQLPPPDPKAYPAPRPIKTDPRDVPKYIRKNGVTRSDR